MPKTLKNILSTLLPMVLIALLFQFGLNADAGDSVGHYMDDPEDLPKSTDENFSEEVSDLPVYSNFVIKDEMNTVFDSPDGRVVDVYMQGPKAEEKKALSFYENTLPQLGWKRTVAKNRPEELKEDNITFSRGEEQLVVTSSEEEDRVLFKFSIRPSDE